MKDSDESRLGMFFALAIIAALVVLESLGTFVLFQRGNHLHALFKNVHELKEGDFVKMGGVQIGRVDSITLTNSVAEITMNLDRKAEVKTDSKATIRFAGLMGQNYVDLDFGSPGEPKAEDGAILKSVEQPDLSEIMVKIDSVATGVQNLTKSFSGEQIDKLLGPLTDLVKNNQTNLGATISNIRNISDNIAQGHGTLGRLINQDDLYVTTINSISNLQNTASDIKRAAEDAHNLIASVQDVVNQVNAGQGTVGKLVKDDALYRTVSDTMTNFDQISQKMNRGDGTIGKLINDDSTLNNVKISLQKLDKATESLEDTGPLSILGTMMTSLF
jgi:phospholipid/cholesterol/gamma-HCH transport system substrate-binding protein